MTQPTENSVDGLSAYLDAIPAPKVQQPARRATPGDSLAGYLDHLDSAPTEAAPRSAGDGGGFFGSVKDVGRAVVQGVKSSGRSVAATAGMGLGRLSDVELLSQAQQSDAQNNPQEMQDLLAEVERRKKANPNAGAVDAVLDVLGAVWDNKTGAVQMVASQLPNTGVSLGSGWAGAKAGAAAGSLVAPGVGTAVGGAMGFLGGMFLGNFALEAGGKGMEAARDGLTGEESSQALTEGAKKAAVVTAVDAATLGAGRLAGKALNAAPIRAGARAEAKVLADAGVDIANPAAIVRALSADAALRETARQAGQQAAAAANSMGRRATQAGTGLTMETFGEGAGMPARPWPGTPGRTTTRSTSLTPGARPRRRTISCSATCAAPG